jgi:mRNA interferase RelE/StbE
MADPYTLELIDDAQEDLDRLDKAVAARIVERLQWLAANAENLSHVALKGKWSGLFRLRIGDYRAIYDLDHGNRLVIVVVIGHRRDVYES